VLTLPVNELIHVVGGRLLLGSDTAYVNGLAIDSREVEPGCAFVAFSGDHVDGHMYAGDAIAAGARAVIVTREEPLVETALRDSRRHDVAVVLVEDALGAVQALARHHRVRLTCPVVAITGSTGKTTTKDLLRSVLSGSMRVVATESNRNNELGVPLTVLDAGPGCGAVVVEMAMRGLGQIAALCDIARPTVGLVTNVGQTHMALLGSEQAIATAKGELVRAIPAHGRVFLNGDDDWARTLAETSTAPVTYYGMGEGAQIAARDLSVNEDGHPSFTLVTPAGSIEVTMAVPGRHNAYNAAAAAAIGLHLGVTLEQIAEGLATATVSGMRMEVLECAGGITVINDAYNANPTSMRAALRTLADMSGDGRRIAVLGDMAELGSLTELAHFGLGEQVARLGIDVLVTVGDRARRIAEGARAEGMAAEVVRSCASVEEAVAVLDEILASGDVVLVKASRSMGLERVVEGIIQPDVQA
jgi:UDP-N-acetylmuramoyl-tripeptide--D-alanyl-D-alanine ligase